MINKLSPKTNFGYDGISTKLLKTIKDTTLRPITVIINQMLNTGIFPEKFKIAKLIPIFKKDNKLVLLTTDQYHFYRLSLKSLKKIFLHRFTSFSLIINYCTMLSMALEQNILLNMRL